MKPLDLLGESTGRGGEEEGVGPPPSSLVCHTAKKRWRRFEQRVQYREEAAEEQNRRQLENTTFHKGY